MLLRPLLRVSDELNWVVAEEGRETRGNVAAFPIIFLMDFYMSFIVAEAATFLGR